MTKMITEQILLKAGFIKNPPPGKNHNYYLLTKEVGSNNGYINMILHSYVINMIHHSYVHMDSRWECQFMTESGSGSLFVDTIEQFNKLMNTMDIDFRLEKE